LAKGSGNIVTEGIKNNCRLTPHRARTQANIRIILIWLEPDTLANIVVAHSMGVSSLVFTQFPPEAR